MLQADTRASMLNKLTFNLSHGSAYGTVHGISKKSQRAENMGAEITFRTLEA